MLNLKVIILTSLLLLFVRESISAPTATLTQKDIVAIDQKNFHIAGIPESSTSNRTAKVLITLDTKITLATQESSFLRAAINLDDPDSFRPVFAREVRRGNEAQEIKLEVDHPKQKVIRVVVWLDKDGSVGAPHPLASDNIAFDAKVFLNSNDR